METADPRGRGSDGGVAEVGSGELEDPRGGSSFTLQRDSPGDEATSGRDSVASQTQSPAGSMHIAPRMTAGTSVPPPLHHRGSTRLAQGHLNP